MEQLRPRGARSGDRDFLLDRDGNRRSGQSSPVRISDWIRRHRGGRGGYAVAAVLMLIAAAPEFRFGIDAEKRSLESIAEPLSSVS